MPIQVIDENRYNKAERQRQQSRDFAQSFGNMARSYNQNQKTQDVLQRQGMDPDLAYVDPSLRNQIVASDLQYGRKMRQAEASGNVPLGRDPNRGQKFLEEINPQARGSLPEYEFSRLFSQQQQMEKEKKSTIKERKEEEPSGFDVEEEEEEKPKKKGKKTNIAFSSTPQMETTGDVRPIYSPEEIQAQGRRIASQSRANGIPMSDSQGADEARKVNADNQVWNAFVDKDIKERQLAQEKYGNLGVSKLTNTFGPDDQPTDEVKAKFRAKGQEAAKEFGQDEAKIDAKLADEAKNYKNAIREIRKSPTAERLYNAPWRKIQGESKTFDQRAKDLRIKLQPLLKEGLYDTARAELSKLGYYPEERERIISDLGENANKVVSQLPNKSNEYNFNTGKFEYMPTEKERENIKNNVYQSFQADPSVNLLLLRRAYEQKGIDWKTFKDIVDEGIIDGTIKLNPDQFKFKDNIDLPPMANLDVILEKLNIVGR